MQTDLKNFCTEMIMMFNEILVRMDVTIASKHVSDNMVTMKENPQIKQTSSMTTTTKLSPLFHPLIFPKPMSETLFLSLNQC